VKGPVAVEMAVAAAAVAETAVAARAVVATAAGEKAAEEEMEGAKAEATVTGVAWVVGHTDRYRRR
jgi:hypothetical protein